MKKFYFVLFAVSLVTLLGCETERTNQPALGPNSYSERTQENGALDSWWSNLTQAQRNSAIASRAAQDVGRTPSPARNCKTWAQQNVVPQASGGYALLPSTLSSNWQWGSNSNIRLVCANMCPPAGAQRGHWVQMRLSSGGPHTAMVESWNSSGITLVHCNWNLDGRVTRDTWTWSQWYSRVSQFSVYEVRGGTS